MKKITNKFIAIIAAAFFLFAGSGYNIVKFCHKGCKMMTEQVSSPSSCSETKKVERSCCKIEQHDKKNNCCKKLHIVKELEDIFSNLSKKEKGCFFVRASVDTPVEVTPFSIGNNEVKCINLIYNTLQDQKRNKDLVYSNIYPPPESEVIFTGREVLTFKSVLLI